MALPEHLQRHLEAGRALAAAGGYRGRFAPSPTGLLHLGNLQTALLSWLAARQAGGAWLLRIDDLDTPRNRAGAIEAIQSDLRWLGLKWDGPVLLQSERRGVYHSWLSWLRRSGRLLAPVAALGVSLSISRSIPASAVRPLTTGAGSGSGSPVGDFGLPTTIPTAVAMWCCGEPMASSLTSSPP